MISNSVVITKKFATFHSKSPLTDGHVFFKKRKRQNMT